MEDNSTLTDEAVVYTYVLNIFLNTHNTYIHMNTHTCYSGIMAFSVIGIGIAFFSIYQMATGTMKKKS